jgi:hypothetical protein
VPAQWHVLEYVSLNDMSSFHTPPPPLQVRAGLAQLGLRSLDELIGHADYLKQKDTPLAKTSE